MKAVVIIFIALLYTAVGIVISPMLVGFGPIKDYYEKLGVISPEPETTISYISRPVPRPEVVYLDSFPTEFGSDVMCLAHNIYFEGRGEGVEGQISIGHVTLNRMKADTHGWPDTVCGNVFKRKAFSWTLDRPYVNLGNRIERTAFLRAITIANGVLKGEYEDKTKGATHYFAPKGMEGGKDPWWAKDYTRVATVGNHIFLK